MAASKQRYRNVAHEQNRMAHVESQNLAPENALMEWVTLSGFVSAQITTITSRCTRRGGFLLLEIRLFNLPPTENRLKLCIATPIVKMLHPGLLRCSKPSLLRQREGSGRREKRERSRRSPVSTDRTVWSIGGSPHVPTTCGPLRPASDCFLTSFA